MLQPTVRRTWAPRGQTPVMANWDRHDRLSVAAALTVSPVRHRLGLYWQIADRNFCGAMIAAVIRRLRRLLGRPLYLVLDRLPAHRTAARQLGAREGRDAGPYRVSWLPAYAPELDPTEHVWGHTKHDDLANYAAADVDDLAAAVDTSLGCTRGDRALLSGFFRLAHLTL